MEKKEILDNQKSDPRPVGRWIIYIDKCTGCGECVDACSLDLLYIENEKVKMKEERYCSECEDCARACAFRAITFR